MSITDRRNRRAWLPFAAACLIALAPAGARGQDKAQDKPAKKPPEEAQEKAPDKAMADTVRLANGTTESGLIQSEEFAGLTLKGAGGKTTLFPWKDVRETTYRQSDEYAAALQTLQSGKIEDAETAFRALAGQTKLRSVVRQQVLFNFAIVLGQMHKGDEAAKTLHDLITEFPHGRYLGAAADILVGSKLGAKDFAGATTELGTIDTATKDFADFRPSVQILKGEVLEAQGKLADAQAAYGAAGMAPGVLPEVKAQADLGTARVNVAQGHASDAEALLRKLVAQDLPGGVLAAAWNGLGDLVLDQGKKSKDPDKILEAAFDYLRSAVQYPPLPGEPTREYERGLAGSAWCFHYIADLEQNPDRKELYTQRYKARVDLLRREYPDSEFLAGL